MTDHGEHKMGTMDISDHKRTWTGFTRLVTVSTVLLAGTTLLLILIFG